MTRSHKLELTIPISEEDLLGLLLSRYGSAKLMELGISPETSVIRSFEMDLTRKCQFRVCAVSPINVEATDFPKAVPAPPPKAEPASACASTEGGGCAASKPIRFERKPKTLPEGP